MIKSIFVDWRNTLGKLWSVIQVIIAVVVFSTLVLIIGGIILLIGILITDTLQITNYGSYTPDTRTYQQRQMDEYELFEKECLSREYSKEQCLVIWSKDDD